MSFLPYLFPLWEPRTSWVWRIKVVPRYQWHWNTSGNDVGARPGRTPHFIRRLLVRPPQKKSKERPVLSNLWELKGSNSITFSGYHNHHPLRQWGCLGSFRAATWGWNCRQIHNVKHDFEWHQEPGHMENVLALNSWSFWSPEVNTICEKKGSLVWTAYLNKQIYTHHHMSSQKGSLQMMG